MGSSRGPSAESQVNARRNSLLKSLQTEQGIDEVTRKELLGRLTGQIDPMAAGRTRQAFAKDNQITALQSEFNKAKEGVDPKYKSRVGTQKLFEALIDKPDARRLRGDILNPGTILRA
jgi:hypothetical protein